MKVKKPFLMPEAPVSLILYPAMIAAMIGI